MKPPISQENETGMFRDITKHLSDWADKQSLTDKAMQGFAIWFQNEGGSIGGWNVAEVRPEFRTHSLCFTSTLLTYPYVTTAIDLYAPDGINIGTYRLITTLDGEADDYFIIEVSKAEHEHRHKQGAHAV